MKKLLNFSTRETVVAGILLLVTAVIFMQMPNKDINGQDMASIPPIEKGDEEGVIDDGEMFVIIEENEGVDLDELLLSIGNMESKLEDLVDRIAELDSQVAELLIANEDQEILISLMSEIMDLGEFSVRFDPNNMRTLSGASVPVLDKFLEGTALEGLGFELLRAEQEYSVNAIGLMAIAREESGLGSSRIAQRYNNVAGIYDGNKRDWKSFETKCESLHNLAGILDKLYLTEGALYFHGYGLRDINTRYALTEDNSGPDWGWSSRVESIGKTYERDAHKLQLTE